MGFFDRFWAGKSPPAADTEQRKEPTVQNLGQGSGGFGEVFGMPSATGVPVNETTAMQVGAVYACVQLLAGIVSTLPLQFFQKTPSGRKPIDHDFWYLFNESATNEYTASAMWEYGMQSRLLDGDFVAWIMRDRRGNPVGIQPLNPRATTVQRMLDQGGWRCYTFWLPTGQVHSVHEDDIIHVPGLGYNGLRSLSPVRHYANQTIGLALGQQQFSERQFGQGTGASYLISTAGKLNEDQKRDIRAEVEARAHGLANVGRPMVLSGADWKLDRLQISPVDMQLLEGRAFSVVEIARIYGVPPHMIGATDKATSWGTGLEAMTQGFVKFTLKRHLMAIQQEANRKLFVKPGVYCEFGLDTLLEGDSAAQAAYFSKALGGPGSQGWMTINEVRHIKNLPPDPDGGEIVKAGSGNGNQKPSDPAQG
ncbi:phage portal protein [Aquitalea magnusonii]|uniref:HK97 family phage portal protein n=1 Tax=Aquitalea magnusonii TaxID=332411 RepID=A0A318JIS8_9NEIS|nr:phage portal protein [Aquitalea magnusonii]PXX49007.1 HK97 family phage portal protein [Aquitalea magnusonii]